MKKKARKERSRQPRRTAKDGEQHVERISVLIASRFIRFACLNRYNRPSSCMNSKEQTQPDQLSREFNQFVWIRSIPYLNAEVALT